jgi:type I pantothenate kinase
MKARYSPYLEFDRDIWRNYRQDAPLTLTEKDLYNLHGQNEEVSLREIIEVYLPLSRLLSLYVTGTQELYNLTSRFLNHPEPKVPYIIGIAGSVAVGKSTTSRVLKALLSGWQSHPRVEIIPTDGFLFPNDELIKRNLLHRKGFPESYDLHKLIEFLSDLKAGKRSLQIPIYSHHQYDITNESQLVDQPDIVILEGLNLLQVPPLKPSHSSCLFVSDFFDFSIYVDAADAIIKQWYLERFKRFRELAKNNPDVYLYRFAQMDEVQALKHAENIWTEINELNLKENIYPYRERARLILEKGEDHKVKKVYLRKI